MRLLLFRARRPLHVCLDVWFRFVLFSPCLSVHIQPRSINLLFGEKGSVLQTLTQILISKLQCSCKKSSVTSLIVKRMLLNERNLLLSFCKLIRLVVTFRHRKYGHKPPTSPNQNFYPKTNTPNGRRHIVATIAHLLSQSLHPSDSLSAKKEVDTGNPFKLQFAKYIIGTTRQRNQHHTHTPHVHAKCRLDSSTSFAFDR